VAVCDADRTVATPLETIDRVGDRKVEHDRIESLVSEYEITILVVGLPLSLNGEFGSAAKTVLSEVKSLRRHLPIEVVTHDERLSTVTAESSLQRQGVDRRKGRAVVDQLAAAVILQAWIDGDRRDRSTAS